MSIRNVARYRGKRFIRAWWRTVAERSVQRTDIAMPGMKDEMKDRLHQWRVGRSLDFARDDTSTHHHRVILSRVDGEGPSQWRVGRSLDFARDDTSTRLSLE